jgi:two-component system sensor histidine kinase UhpB
MADRDVSIERLVGPDVGDMATLAGAICGTPLALIALVDAQGSIVRLTGSSADLSAFCAHAVQGLTGTLIVEDAAADPRLAGHPMFAGAPGIRLFVAIPMRSTDGIVLGTLCIVDYAPRVLTAEQRAAMDILGNGLMHVLDLRRTKGELERALVVRDRTVAERDEAKRDLEAKIGARTTALTHILDRVADAVIALDTEWRYTYVNLKAAELLGRRREDLVGRSAWEKYPEAVGDVFYVAYHEAVREQTPRVVEGYFGPWRRWFENRIYPSPDGLTVFFSETTELRRAHDAVARSEARLRLLVATSGTGLFDWDVVTNDLYFSPECKKLIGFDDDELPNRFEELASRLHPDDAGSVEAARAYVAAPEGDFKRELRMRHRDGTYRWLASRAAVVRDSAGQSTRLVGSLIDITDKKSEQARLERSHEELRRLSGDLLRTREDDRTRIAREIHDELGQSLTALKMDVAWLQRRDRGHESTWTQKLHDMSMALDETVATVRRISADLRPGLLDDLGLAAAIEWQAEDFETHAEVRCQADVRLTHRPPDNVATALFRIVQESLTNVARHAQATTVVIRMTSEPDRWELTIADDGVGMVAPATAGLASVGLTGMRERARLVGGELTIESAPGQGTTVRARVPRPGEEGGARTRPGRLEEVP